ncbi:MULTISPECIES: hypothetical protein [Lactobacillales]|uniref:hypothetical protein n=1 Tax=Lactobacillales TaxID=186826 RepID=UPI002FC86A2C
MFELHSLVIPQSKEQQAFRKEIDKNEIDEELVVKGFKQCVKAFVAIGKAMNECSTAFSNAMKKMGEYAEDYKRVSEVVDKNKKTKSSSKFVSALIEDVKRKNDRSGGNASGNDIGDCNNHYRNSSDYSDSSERDKKAD